MCLHILIMHIGPWACQNKDSFYKDKITTINFITTKGRLEEEAASYPCFLPFVQGVKTFFCVDVFDGVCRDDCRGFGFLNCCKIFYWWVGLFLFDFFPKDLLRCCTFQLEMIRNQWKIFLSCGYARWRRKRSIFGSGQTDLVWIIYHQLGFIAVTPTTK